MHVYPHQELSVIITSITNLLFIATIISTSILAIKYKTWQCQLQEELYERERSHTLS